MKKLRAFIRKEFYHIGRDVRTLIVMFGIPIIQVLLFGYVLTNEIKDVNIAVLDLAKDNESEKLINKLVSSGYFQLSESIASYDEVDELLKSGRVKEVLIIESGFAAKLERDKLAHIRIIADASDPNNANMIVNYTKGVIAGFLTEMNAGSANAQAISMKPKMLFNPEMKGVYMFIPGILTLILMLISAMITSISIAREKELGTMEVLLVSPLNPIQIIIGKILPYLVLSFFNAFLIILLGIFVFEIPVLGSFVLLMAESLLFIILALSIGIFISTVAKSQQVAIMISLVALMLPTILLSGFIFPIDNMPLVLQRVSNIIPAKWFIIIIKNVMIKGTGFEYIWKETLILVAMCFFFIAVSVKKFKIRLE
ncbi:MAG: ABC transporter permease [Bacteroidales bacterium]|nr:ABC transporter permease [Bacteroidales bacterium]